MSKRTPPPLPEFNPQEYNLTPQQPIPRRIFFIAIGPIPEKFLYNIQRITAICQQQIPPFQVEIFTDKEKNIENAISKSDILSHQYTPNIRNISEIINDIAQNNDNFYTVHEKSTLLNQIQADLVGLRNLASVSDLLRHQELRKNGGYYIDWDTEIDLDPKKPIPQMQQDFDFKCAGYLKRKENKIALTCNTDIFASIPNHPIINNFIKYIIKNHAQNQEARKYPDPKHPKHHMTFDDARRIYDDPSLSKKYDSFRTESNIQISGPIGFKTILKEKLGNSINKYQQHFFNSKDHNSSDKHATFKVAGLDLVSVKTYSWTKKTNQNPKYFDHEFQGDIHDKVSTKEKPSKKPQPTSSSSTQQATVKSSWV